MNSKTGKEHIPDFFEINSKKDINKKEIVDSFNRFFSTIGSDISDKVPVSQTPYSQLLNQRHDKSIFLDPMTPLDTINIRNIKIKIIKPVKAMHNNISTKPIKQSIEQISIPLTHILNQSMTTGIVPQNMKIAKVIPIFKSGDNYLQ